MIRAFERGTWAVMACLALGGVEACRRGDDVAGVIDRQTFIDTYVDLRRAGMATPTHQLPDTARDRILAAHGVTRDQLMTFADVRGADPDYMVAVWTEVSARMAPADTVPPTSQPSYLDTMVGPRPPSAPLVDTFSR